MALEGATFKRGGVTFPLSATPTNSSLLDADPAVYYCLAYFESVLNTYMGGRLAYEAAQSGISTITNAVAYTVPDEPSDYLTEEQVKFPLLCVYRARARFNDKSITYRHTVGDWRVAYVLPPMTAGQRERLMPLLNAVPSIIDDRCEAHYDAGYLSGAQVFGPSYANLESISVTDVDHAKWDAGGELVFPAVILTLEVKERANQVTTAYDALAGADTNLDAAQTGTTSLSDVVQVATTTT